MTTIMSSRQFNQDTGGAKKAAEAGPVLITDRGKTTHVLLNIEDYEKIKKPSRTLYEAFSDFSTANSTDFSFDIPELKGDWGLQIPDFSE